MIRFLLSKFALRKQKKISLFESQIKTNKVVIGYKSITPKINVTIRKERSEKTFLTIGNNSIVNGDYIFENENGVIKIGDRTFIGGGKFICINNIEIGDDVLISWGCTITDNNSHSLKWSERKEDVLDWKRGIDENKIGAYKDWRNVRSSPIIIKNKAWIGFEVVLLKGVTIGEGSIVGSRSVVTKEVPDWTIVAGNPAKIIRGIPENER